MKILSLKLPDLLDQELSARAKRKGTTKSAIVREAIEGYLHSDSPPPSSSALALVGDLVGCLEGPGDLSTNKDYFKDFGR